MTLVNKTDAECVWVAVTL